MTVYIWFSSMFRDSFIQKSIFFLSVHIVGSCTFRESVPGVNGTRRNRDSGPQILKVCTFYLRHVCKDRKDRTVVNEDYWNNELTSPRLTHWHTQRINSSAYCKQSLTHKLRSPLHCEECNAWLTTTMNMRTASSKKLQRYRAYKSHQYTLMTATYVVLRELFARHSSTSIDRTVQYHYVCVLVTRQFTSYFQYSHSHSSGSHFVNRTMYKSQAVSENAEMHL